MGGQQQLTYFLVPTHVNLFLKESLPKICEPLNHLDALRIPPERNPCPSKTFQGNGIPLELRSGNAPGTSFRRSSIADRSILEGTPFLERHSSQESRSKRVPRYVRSILYVCREELAYDGTAVGRNKQVSGNLFLSRDSNEEAVGST